MITNELRDKFKKLYYEKFSITLSDEEATVMAMDLVNLMKVLLLSLIHIYLLNKNTDKKRMLFIDEAHKLLVDPEVAIFYRELVKQARKRNVGCLLYTSINGS